MKLTRSPLIFLTLASICLLGPHAKAQLTAQTGDGLLTLQAEMPAQAHAGSEFSYTVKITNSSDNMTLHDIVLKQRETDGLTIESVSLQSPQTDERQADSKKKSQAEKPDRQSSNRASLKKTDREQDDKQQVDREQTKEQQVKRDMKPNQDVARQGDNETQTDAKQIRLETLQPGESKTFVVKATADKEGDLRSCLEIASYTPSICLKTTVVKPELQLTKTAPQEANRCDVIELAYTLKNAGTGDVGPIQITDDLGEGLKTIDGENSLKFDVDGLPAGDTRKFVAKVFATQAGSFSSRATATATESELTSRSENTTTEVSAADLAVEVTGPGDVYGGKTAKFTAVVMNTGNSDAKNVNVKVMWSEQASLGDLGKASMEETRNDAKNAQNNNQQPTPAKSKPSDKQKSGAADPAQTTPPENGEPKVKMAEKEFKIQNLAAGQSARFEYTIRPGDLDQVRTQVVATYVCDVAAAEDQKQAQGEATASAMATAQVVRLSALQIVVVDDQDPVATGENVTYKTRLWNEGDADDKNVQIKLMIPDGLEFVSAEGPTKFKQEGSTVVFEPIKVMKPAQREDFILVAKAKGTGTVKLKAELTSDTLDELIVSEEPTELVDENPSPTKK